MLCYYQVLDFKIIFMKNKIYIIDLCYTCFYMHVFHGESWCDKTKKKRRRLVEFFLLTPQK